MRNYKYPIFTGLLILVLFLPIGSRGIWTSPVPLAFGKEEGKKSEEKKEAPKEAKKESSAPMPGGGKAAPDMPYTALAEKNIFSPERKEFPIFTPPEPMKKPPVRPQVILYGVTIAGDYQSASIVQPGRALRKGEREMMTLKAGERIGEYILTKITPDGITLEGEGDTFEVLLYDSAKPKTRTAVRTETRPVAVTSAQPGPTGPAPTEPPRPGAPGVPASEVPRPSLPSPVPGQERVGMPPSVPSPVPQAVTPGTAPTPTPVTPPVSPTYTPVPRRSGRTLPGTPGIPGAQTPAEPQGSGRP